MPWCVPTVSAPQCWHHPHTTTSVCSVSHIMYSMFCPPFFFFSIHFTQSYFFNAWSESHHSFDAFMLFFYTILVNYIYIFFLETLYSIKMQCYRISDPIAHLLSSTESSFFLCCSAMAKNFSSYSISTRPVVPHRVVQTKYHILIYTSFTLLSLSFEWCVHECVVICLIHLMWEISYKWVWRSILHQTLVLQPFFVCYNKIILYFKKIGS